MLRTALTPRERQIVQLLADGKTNKETASALGVKTIEAISYVTPFATRSSKLEDTC